MATGQTQIAQLLLTTAQNNIIAGLGQEVVESDTGEKYFQSGDEHMDCLKDILRQLRREHPTKRALCVSSRVEPQDQYSFYAL